MNCFCHYKCRGSRPARLFCLWLSVTLLGCGGDPAAETETRPAAAAPTPTAPARRVSADENSLSIAELRERLGIGQAGQIQKIAGEIVGMDLRATTVVDLSPLAGLPLQRLFLEETKVSDISALEGMPLEQLYLSHTQVTDLSPLAGGQIQELNLVGTPIEDISPLKDAEVGTLWIPQTKVSDLSPLAGKSFVSLDIQGTPVSDLSPLAGNTSLRRLHIADTNVTDLSPLTGLKLQRLIFSPERITAGIDAIRNMPSLRGLDVQFDAEVNKVLSAAEFWRKYDAGEWAINEGESSETIRPATE